MIKIFDKENIKIYEVAPTFRTIYATINSSQNPIRFYIYFPYIQFIFYESEFDVWFSKTPYPSCSINFMEMFKTHCLGDKWVPWDHSHVDNINQYWNTTFLADYTSLIDLVELQNLSTRHGSSLWQCKNAGYFGEICNHYPLSSFLKEIE